MGAYYQTVLVSRGSTGVDNATVTVTSTVIPTTGSGSYVGHLSSPLNAGGKVTLVVTDGSQKVDASAPFPPHPSLTQPTSTQTVDVTQPLG